MQKAKFLKKIQRDTWNITSKLASYHIVAQKVSFIGNHLIEDILYKNQTLLKTASLVTTRSLPLILPTGILVRLVIVPVRSLKNKIMKILKKTQKNQQNNFRKKSKF